jgi:D-aminoacyl-tRNA deacylase
MSPQGEPATVILASTTDLASRTLADALVEGEGFQSTGINLLGNPVYQKDSYLLARFEGMIVHPPSLDEYFKPQAYIFLSRHSAESGIASLTGHTTGNFSAETKFGGGGKELARSDPSLLKNYLITLWKHREEVKEYEITMEATHHGPTSLQKPVLFVEMGSSQKHWGDKKAASVVGRALMESLREKAIWSKAAIGFGGTHYPEKFTRLLIDGDVALAFVAPKYALEYIDERMVGQMIQRSTAPVRYAALDWKGLGPHKEKVVSLVKRYGLEEIRL